MIIDTLTFSNKAEGWTSRWTYRPEWMIGLNSTFYSFKNGNLYQHDTNINRTQFYNQSINSLYGFSIETIINNSPVDTKMFKSLNLDCTNALNVIGSTDLDQLQIDSAQFSKKEGDFFAYIRRPQNQLNLDLLSVQGVGTVTSTSVNTININTPFTIVSNGDKVYKANYIPPVTPGDPGQIINLLEVGEVSTTTSNSITTILPFVNTPLPGEYIFINKSSSAESYGSRGRFLNLSMGLSGTSATGEVELFAVKTSVFKSFP
jgi:hypothetical protein